MNDLPLYGFQVLSLSINLPGPVASARLQEFGASVVKVEPPEGDPLALFVPAWYQAISSGQKVLSFDLKCQQGQAYLDKLLAESDLLLTASRPAALQRLGLGWNDLHNRHPHLCQVAILGYPAPEEDRPGHDLTYQAEFGLVNPPHMPRTLLADLAGAERAVSAALALLLARSRGGGAGYAAVSLAAVAETFSRTLQYGLTTPGGILGGGRARYNLYPAKQGWVAVAALEHHFWQKLVGELGLELDAEWENLEAIFCIQTAQYWEHWARSHDLPLVAVK